MAEVAPAVPPNRQRDFAPLQVFGQPPLLKKESDIHLYLRRFLAYADSIGAQEDDLVSLLVNAASDEVLQKIERHLHDDLTFDELAEILKRELGEGLENREEYKSELRRATRGRNETVREFFTRLWHLGKKAYPQDQEEAIRNNAVREVFVAGFNDPEIAARLREHAEMNNEEILEFASLLASCKVSSQSRLTNSTVNACGEQNDETEKITNLLVDKIITVCTMINQQQDKTANNNRQTTELNMTNEQPQTLTNTELNMTNEQPQTLTNTELNMTNEQPQTLTNTELNMTNEQPQTWTDTEFNMTNEQPQTWTDTEYCYNTELGDLNTEYDQNFDDWEETNMNTDEFCDAYEPQYFGYDEFDQQYCHGHYETDQYFISELPEFK